MEGKSPDKQSVKVTILGHAYTLRTSGHPHEVQAVAESVNDLMLSIANKAPDADATRIAVMACLHLSDRLRRLEAEVAELRKSPGGLDERTYNRVAGMLDQLIAAAGVP